MKQILRLVVNVVRNTFRQVRILEPESDAVQGSLRVTSAAPTS